MCGIAGLVARAGRASGDGVIEGMTEALQSRGPDEQRVWADDVAALGVRRLSVVDPVGGAQPIVCRTSSGEQIVLAYTGEVYNFENLRTQLQGHGHRFVTRCDTEVVLRAFAEWGTGCAERLEGMFAFAVWEQRPRRLTLVRDRFGVYPLYYAKLPGGFAFGSEPKALLKHPDIQPRVDGPGLLEALSLAKTPGEGVFVQMREVRPGHHVTYAQDSVSEGCYWRLQPAPHEDDREATVGRVRDYLDEIVARELVADVPLCSMLSGGLDSSAVAALAARELAKSGERLTTFSVDFTSHAANFALDEVREAPDAPFVRVMAEHLGSRHTNVVLDSSDLMSPEVRSRVLAARDFPTALGDLYSSLLLLAGKVRERSTVALTGDGADEYFGGYHFFHEIAQGDGAAPSTFAWIEAARRYPGADLMNPFGLFDADLKKSLRQEEYEADRYHDAVNEMERMPGESELDARMRVVTYTCLTRYLAFILDRKDRMAMANSLEGRVPLLDHRLVEYVYNTPWQMRTFDGREKSLLRAAVADLLPAAVRDRVKAPYPITLDPLYDEMLRVKLRDLVSDNDQWLAQVGDVTAVRSLLLAPADHPELNRTAMEGLIMTRDWLKEYSVQLVV